MKRVLVAVVLLALIATVMAQRRGGRWGGWGGWGGRDYEAYKTPREIPQHTYETPTWTNTPGFEKDVFTFARIIREYAPDGSGGPWTTDTPDSDLNLSFRLQQMTAMKVSPDGRFLRLSDKDLFKHPFIYMVEPGSLFLSDEEAATLRRYLLNGGFLFLDDFWGEYEWENLERELAKVFPDRKFVELGLDHVLYRYPFEIKSKNQVPAVDRGTASQYTGITWERADAKEVHHRVILDDKNRIMVIATHNTDNGDGWEWEGENQYYFAQFAERTAYPLAINIIFYAMTH